MHSALHEDTNRFCADTLCIERTCSFVNDNFVVWGCDATSVVGLQLANTLHIKTYPFMAVLVNVSNSNTFIAYLQSMGYDPRALRPGSNVLTTIQGWFGFVC